MAARVQTAGGPGAAWLLLGLAGIAAAPAAAWTPAAQETIAREAVRLVPPDLARLAERHGARLAAGARAPSRSQPGVCHQGEALTAAIAREVERAVAAIESHRPFAEIFHQLGVVAHYVADAGEPLAAAASDPEEGRYAADWLAYSESALPRFALLFYGLLPELAGRRDVSPLVERSLARGRRLYPLVGREYRRVGFRPGLTSFDDRSTAFAVASLAFSHAVTDVALVLRQVWLAAGGSDPRRALPARGGRLVRLPRAAEVHPGRGATPP